MEYICPEKNCVYEPDEVQCTCGAEEKPCIPDWEDVVFVADDFLKSRSKQLDEKLNQPGFTERSKKQALELLDTQPRTRKRKPYLRYIKNKIKDAAVPSFDRCYPMYFVDEEQKADGHSTPRVRPKRGSIRYEDIPATRCNELTQLNSKYNMQPIWADDLKTSLKKENLVDAEWKKQEYRKVSRKRVPIFYHGTHSCGPRLESLTYLYAYEYPYNRQQTKYLRASSLDGAKERLKYLYPDLDQGALNRLLRGVVKKPHTAQSDNKAKVMATFINPKCGYGWIGKIDQAIDKTKNSIKSSYTNENIVFKFRRGVVNRNGIFIPKKQDWTKFNKKKATDIENAYNTRVQGGGYQNATLDNNATIVWTRYRNHGDIMNNNNEKIGEVRREVTDFPSHNWDEYAQECVNPQLYCYPKLTGTPDNKKAALKDSFEKLHRLNTCVAERADEVQKMRSGDKEKTKNHKEVLGSYKYIREQCRKDIERALEEDKESSLKPPSCDEAKDPDSNCLLLVPYIVRKSGGNRRLKYLIKTCGSRTNLLADLPDGHVYQQDQSKVDQLWNDKEYLKELGTIFSRNLGVDPAVGPEEIRRLLTGVSRGTVAIKKRGDDLYVTKLIGDMDIDFGI